MSNGSEHMPERCVHAPVGPDWAGLREPSSWKERALAAEEDRDELRRALDDAIGVANKNKIALDSAEAERDALLAIEQRLTDHIVQLAAERDALQAENAQLQVYLSENRRALDDAIKVANGNKSAGDALQAEVERMRADLHEWETVGAPAWVAAKDAQLAEAWAERDALQARLDAMTVEWGTAAVAGDDRTIHRDTFRSEDAARNARGYGESIVTRLVGPWTVVPEGDANA